jgi:hypothetical protein
VELGIQLEELVLPRHGELDEELLRVLTDEHVGRRGFTVWMQLSE